MLIMDSEGSFERNSRLANATETSDCYPLTICFKILRSKRRNDLLKGLFSANKFAVLGKWNAPMSLLVD